MLKSSIIKSYFHLHSMQSANNLPSALLPHIHEILTIAIQYAKFANRKTVLLRDLQYAIESISPHRPCSECGKLPIPPLSIG